MKKNILIAIMAMIFVGLSAVAQESKAWNRNKYINFAYSTQTLENVDAGLNWKSEYGFGLSKGTTYYLHKKPIAGMIKFGIDWTQIDVNYAKLTPGFEVKSEDDDNDSNSSAGSSFDDILGGVEDGIENEADKIINKDYGQHQLEACMHVGPSITVNPIDALNINAYFRYAPTFSTILYKDATGDNQASFAFANFFVTGGAVSWNIISVGAEYRWGSAKYNIMSFNSEDLIGGDTEGSVIKKVKNKMITQGMRVYVSLRF